jgi:hypothetical protein
VDNCNVRGCGRGHNYLLHDVLQNEEVMMVSALPGRVSELESVLRCRQMVAAENEGQCFRLNVLYDWGATVSMISEEAVEVMGLSIAKQAKRIIKGLGGATTVSKGTCTLSLVARNGDRKTVTAWEVGEIASLPGGQPPEDVDEQFPGLRYLSEPNCLIQRAGPIHVLLGMDHAHLMPEHNVGREHGPQQPTEAHELHVRRSTHPRRRRSTAPILVRCDGSGRKV